MYSKDDVSLLMKKKSYIPNRLISSMLRKGVIYGSFLSWLRNAFIFSHFSLQSSFMQAISIYNRYQETYHLPVFYPNIRHYYHINRFLLFHMRLQSALGQSFQNVLPSLLLLFLVVTSVSETIYLQKFPVDRILAVQVETRLQRLKSSLQTLSPNSDKQDLYLRAKLAEVYLQEMARQSLDSYDNLMQGSKNSVSGVDNIVMGSKNKVNGKGNWIFSTDYNQSGDNMENIAFEHLKDKKQPIISYKEMVRI